MTTTFILIRHGETQWNREGRLMGITDIPLTSEGKRQSAKVAETLKSYPLDVIFSSPLTRTRETARAIYRFHKHIPFIVHQDLRERNFGVAEGFGYEDVNRVHPELIYTETWNYRNFRPENGESLADLEKRADSFLSLVFATYEGKKIGVVSHGTFLRVLICQIIDIALPEFAQLHMDNTAITILEHSQAHGGIIHALNYTAHLPELMKTI